MIATHSVNCDTHFLAFGLLGKLERNLLIDVPALSAGRVGQFGRSALFAQ
jgi:hypothetical protein